MTDSGHSDHAEEVLGVDDSVNTQTMSASWTLAIVRPQRPGPPAIAT